LTSWDPLEHAAGSLSPRIPRTMPQVRQELNRSLTFILSLWQRERRGPRSVRRVSQQEHHRTRTFQEEYRELLGRHGVHFDERYVWGLRMVDEVNRAFSGCCLAIAFSQTDVGDGCRTLRQYFSAMLSPLPLSMRTYYCIGSPGQ
jgi:hypothetical protein